jgi:hypothetical protein
MARGLVCQRCAAHDWLRLSFAGRAARWRTPWLPVAVATRHPVYAATVRLGCSTSGYPARLPGRGRFNVAQARPSDGVRSRSRHVGRALPGGAPVPVRRSTPAASIHRTSPLLHEIGHGGEEPARHVRDVAQALEDPVARRAVRRIAPLASSAVVHPTPADSWVDDDLGCSFPAATSALGRRVRLSLGPRLLDRRHR